MVQAITNHLNLMYIVGQKLGQNISVYTGSNCTLAIINLFCKEQIRLDKFHHTFLTESLSKQTVRSFHIFALEVEPRNYAHKVKPKKKKVEEKK